MNYTPICITSYVQQSNLYSTPVSICVRNKEAKWYYPFLKRTQEELKVISFHREVIKSNKQNVIKGVYTNDRLIFWYWEWVRRQSGKDAGLAASVRISFVRLSLSWHLARRSQSLCAEHWEVVVCPPNPCRATAAAASFLRTGTTLLRNCSNAAQCRDLMDVTQYYHQTPVLHHPSQPCQDGAPFTMLCMASEPRLRFLGPITLNSFFVSDAGWIL